MKIIKYPEPPEDKEIQYFCHSCSSTLAIQLEDIKLDCYNAPYIKCMMCKSHGHPIDLPETWIYYLRRLTVYMTEKKK